MMQYGLSWKNIRMLSGGVYNRGFSDIDCHKISCIIVDSIHGELRDVPLYGTADQYIINEDFLSSSAIMKKAKVFYNSAN
jgi:hypothetical protein